MSFFNKLENKDNLSLLQTDNNTIDTLNNNDYTLNDKTNNTTTNIKLSNFNDTLNEKASAISNSISLIGTQDNIDKFKIYIQLIQPEHHYFINYNDCYNTVSNILLEKDKVNMQELRNNIKLGLSKYKQIKQYKFSTNNNSIKIIDLKKKNIVETIYIPICINVKELHAKSLKNMNNIYIKTKLAYELLLLNENNNDNKLADFKKLRNNCQKKINEYYILQYLLNFLNKYNPNNNHFTTHTINQVYSPSKDITRTLLVLGNSHLNKNIIDNIIELESELLDNYNLIKQKIAVNTITEDKDLQSHIKEYIEKKKHLDNKIKKLNDIKTKERSTTIYLTNEQIAQLNFSAFKNYARTLTEANINNSNNNLSENNKNI